MNPDGRRDWADSLLPSVEEREQTRQDAYEAALVEHLLRRCGLTSLKRELLEEARQLHKQQLRFFPFAVKTGFPLWLATEKISGVHELDIADLYHRITKLKIFKAFAEVEHDRPAEFAEKPYGLVFQWPALAKFVVIHTRAPQLHHPDTHLLLFRRFGAEQQSVTIESLDSLLAQLGSPDSWV